MTQTFDQQTINNIFDLEGLFIETCLASTTTISKARYTLRPTDRIYKTRTFKSLNQLYVEIEDVTEYNFAIAHLDNYQHWMALCECEWFQPFLMKWREELEMKLKAKAIDTIKFHANDETRHTFEASKFLATAGWRGGQSTKKQAKDVLENAKVAMRGRPSKVEIQQRLDEAAFNQERVNSDFRRLTDLQKLN